MVEHRPPKPPTHPIFGGGWLKSVPLVFAVSPETRFLVALSYESVNLVYEPRFLDEFLYQYARLLLAPFSNVPGILIPGGWIETLEAIAHPRWFSPVNDRNNHTVFDEHVIHLDEERLAAIGV